MPGLGDLFSKGSIGEQLLIWGVLNQVIGAAISPGVVELTSLVNEAAPVVPMSAAEAAELVLRGYADHGDGEGEARKTGVNTERFNRLIELAGSAPPASAMLEAFRRNIIGLAGGPSDPALETGLQQLGIKPQWWDMLRSLAVQPPTPDEALNALLEGQISRDEAYKRYVEGGGDPTWFQDSFNARGSAPTPVEAADMANRRIIPWDGEGPEVTSFHQAFLEGPWRNKWEESFRKLAIYRPPPRTVTALLRAGTITESEALQYFEDYGLSEATAKQYVADASHHATSAARELSQAQIVSLYEDKLIDQPTAHAHLVTLRYSPADADLLLSLADTKAAATAVRSATTRLRTLFESGTADAATTLASLRALGLTDAQSTALLAVWQLGVHASPKTLSASQVDNAFYYQLMDQATAQARLEALGYSAHDAWLLLSIRSKNALPNEPPQ